MHIHLLEWNLNASLAQFSINLFGGVELDSPIIGSLRPDAHLEDDAAVCFLSDNLYVSEVIR